MADENKAMETLARVAQEAFANGWERVCLSCNQPFNGDACPRCWPAKMDGTDDGLAWGLSPKHVYQWVCIRLGATRTPGDERRWMAVREALTVAITNSDFATKPSPPTSTEGQTNGR